MTPSPTDFLTQQHHQEMIMQTATAPTVIRAAARRAGVTLGVASLLAIAGFTALGSVFSYPQILAEPAADILTSFSAHQPTVMVWFGVLVLSAALLAPAGVWLGQLTGGRLGGAITWAGIGAATVQVVGLQRWLTLVPGISAEAADPSREASAIERFSFWHGLLGTAVGETLGYALTATFTVLVVVALRRRGLPRWLCWLGLLAAGLIATGVVVPVLEAASLTNFVGYVLWCGWLLVVAAILTWSPPTYQEVAS